MYIRTENGIYAYDKQRIVEKDNKAFFTERLIPLNILDLGEIVKQAYTIEELCDEFVVVPNAPAIMDMKPKLQKGMEFEEISQTYINSKKHTIVYGAIWTSKGLQFVARMNNEGKLELI